MVVFITGATGALGQPVLQLLVKAGHQVRALSRSPANDAVIKHLDGEPVRANLFDDESLREGIAGADAVLHLATKIPTTQKIGWRRAWRENDAIRREGTRNLVDVALEQAQLEIITRLAVAAEFRDDDTGEHTKRVGRNAAAIAYALGWPDDEVQLLYTAARLHDVGKIGISNTILHKPAKLTPEEMAKMQTHTTIGARILSAGNSELLELAEEIAVAHHEAGTAKATRLVFGGRRLRSVPGLLPSLTCSTRSPTNAPTNAPGGRLSMGLGC
jgi:HD-GYP domain-containing protein (c-di-GMP phosphodiesterase class II)